MKHDLYLKKHSPIQAVIFDWAGTLIDFGCIAPVVMFLDVFKQAGVPISLEEARKPMGVHEQIHIREILEMESVRSRWKNKLGRLPTDQDGEDLFDKLMSIQLDSLAHYAVLIPGALKVVEALRYKNIKIGTTTGYKKEMTEVYLKAVEEQGFVPDAAISSSGVPKSRPYPYMCLQTAIELEVDRVQACVKVDDTIPGVQEGLNAGMWTIGVAASGNEMGLTLEQYLNLIPISRAEKGKVVANRLYQAGAHYVIETIADILPCLALIEKRIERGEFPSQPALEQRVA